MAQENLYQIKKESYYMKKIPKELLALIGIVAIICIVLLASSASSKKGGDTTEVETSQQSEVRVASVDPYVLPEKAVVANIIGFEPNQIDRLTDEFVFRDFKNADNMVAYGYQNDEAANGTRLYLLIEKMSEDEYKASLPAENVSESIELEGRNAVYADRYLYHLPEGEDPGEGVNQMVQNGEAVVEYGKTLLEEDDVNKDVSELQTVDWYENGCKFELYVKKLSLSEDEVINLAQYYLTDSE
jgi:hypothetical protein